MGDEKKEMFDKCEFIIESSHCLNCSFDYTKKWMSSTCTECPNDVMQSFLLFLAVVWLILLTVSISYQTGNLNSKHSTVNDNRIVGDVSLNGFGIFRIVFSHLQFLGLFVYINMESVDSIGSFFSFSESLSMSGFSWANCIFSSSTSDAEAILFSKSVFLAVIPLFCLSVIFVTGTVLYLKHINNVYQERLSLVEIKNKGVTFFLSFIYILLPSFWKTGLAYFACENDLLLFDSGTSCSDTNFKKYKMFFGILILLAMYGSGGLLILTIIIKYDKSYKSFFNWKEPILAVLAVCLVLLQNLAQRKQLLGLFVVFFIRFITCDCSLKLLYLLRKASCFVLASTVFLVALLKPSSTTNDISNSFISVVVILINLLFVVYALMNFTYIWSYEQVSNDCNIDLVNSKTISSSRSRKFWRYVLVITKPFSLNKEIRQNSYDCKNEFVQKELISDWHKIEANYRSLNVLLHKKDKSRDSESNLESVSLNSLESAESSIKFDMNEEFLPKEKLTICKLNKSKQYNGKECIFLNLILDKKRIEVKVLDTNTVIRVKRQNIMRNIDCCSEASSVNKREEDVEFSSGQVLKIFGLKKKAQFNGLRVVFIKYKHVGNKKRVEVELSNGTLLQLKPKNLIHLEETNAHRDEDTYTVYSDHSTKSNASRFDLFCDKLQTSCKLRIVNLKKASLRSEYEHRVGKFVNIDSSSRRIIVQLDNGAILKLKSRNVELVEDKSDVMSLAATEFTSNTKKQYKDDICPGDRVEIFGLKKNKEFNGKQGRFIRINENDNKAEIEMEDGSLLRLRRKNLKRLNNILNAVTTKNSDAVSVSEVGEVHVRIDDEVVLCNLKKQAAMNGKEGRLLRITEDLRKGEVVLGDGTIMLVRLKNIKRKLRSSYLNHTALPGTNGQIQSNEGDFSLNDELKLLREENRILREEIEILDRKNRLILQG